MGDNALESSASEGLPAVFSRDRTIRKMTESRAFTAALEKTTIRADLVERQERSLFIVGLISARARRDACHIVGF